MKGVVLSKYTAEGGAYDGQTLYQTHINGEPVEAATPDAAKALATAEKYAAQLKVKVLVWNGDERKFEEVA